MYPKINQLTPITHSIEHDRIVAASSIWAGIIVSIFLN